MTGRQHGSKMLCQLRFGLLRCADVKWRMRIVFAKPTEPNLYTGPKKPLCRGRFDDLAESCYRRPAFLPRAVARDTPFGLRLNGAGRMADHIGRCRSLGRNSEEFLMVSAGNGRRAVGASVHRSLPLRFTVQSGKLFAFCNAHHAVVNSVPVAASRQPRLHALAQSQQRSGERKAEHGQQQDGKQSTQVPLLEHLNRRRAIRTELSTKAGRAVWRLRKPTADQQVRPTIYNNLRCVGSRSADRIQSLDILRCAQTRRN